jgi:hypothetical protein
MPVIPATWEVRWEGCELKVSPGKKLVRACHKEQIILATGRHRK